jgi:hypothetical protein
LPVSQRAEQLAYSINAAGGALPVTTETVVSRHKVLYFSRQAQLAGSVLPPGTVSLCRVTGLLRDQETVLLRCGSGFVKVQLDHIVSGLPRALNSLAVQTLRQKRTAIWVNAGNEGEPLQAGLRNKGTSHREEVWVDLVEILEGRSKTGPILGAICRTNSLALYWLPAREAGWTSLSQEELTLVARRNWKYRACVIRPEGRDEIFLSLIRLPEVWKEFSALCIGKELAVQVLRRRSAEGTTATRYLVETRGSRIALEVESPDGQELGIDQLILVEVVQCGIIAGGQPNVHAVPVGERRYTLDLPMWMMKEPPKVIRHEFRDFLSWMAEPPRVPALDTWPPQEISNSELLRGLCHVWRLRPEGPPGFTIFRWQVNLAKIWWQRNQNRREMDLSYALMSLLLLHGAFSLGEEKFGSMEGDLRSVDLTSFVPEWRDTFQKLFNNIVRRSMRSLHVEIIWQDWLSPDPSLSSVGNMQLRLEKLRMGSSMNIETFRSFEHFCRAVEIRQAIPGYRALLPIYDAIRRAMGQIELTDALAGRSEILQELIDLGRVLPPTCSGYSPRFLDSQVDFLKRLLDKLVSQGIDITLLEPLTNATLRPAAMKTAE